MLACSTKLKDIFLGDWTIELSPTTVGSLLSEKAFHKESIILNSNNETISNNEELAEIFKKHFSKLVENLDIDETLASHRASSDITDPVFNAIKKYEDHPSIKKSNISWAVKTYSSCLILKQKIRF